jgi:hypothetical protein
MFWVYMALLLAVVLGWAAWFDRRKKVRRINAPDRPITGDSSMMWRSSEVENLTRPRDPDREQ